MILLDRKTVAKSFVTVSRQLRKVLTCDNIQTEKKYCGFEKRKSVVADFFMEEKKCLDRLSLRSFRD